MMALFLSVSLSVTRHGCRSCRSFFSDSRLEKLERKLDTVVSKIDDVQKEMRKEHQEVQQETQRKWEESQKESQRKWEEFLERHRTEWRSLTAIWGGLKALAGLTAFSGAAVSLFLNKDRLEAKVSGI